MWYCRAYPAVLRSTLPHRNYTTSLPVDSSPPPQSLVLWVKTKTSYSFRRRIHRQPVGCPVTLFAEAKRTSRRLLIHGTRGALYHKFIGER